MALTTDFRAFHLGSNATIPAGWSEDTDYAVQFIQGGPAGFTGATTGGANVHFHLMLAHGHTGSNHVHLLTSGATAASTSSIHSSVIPTAKFSGTTGIHSHLGTFSSASQRTYSNAFNVPTSAV